MEEKEFQKAWSMDFHFAIKSLTVIQDPQGGEREKKKNPSFLFTVRSYWGGKSY